MYKYMYGYSNTINAQDFTFPVFSTLLDKIKKLRKGWDMFTETKTRLTDNAKGQSAITFLNEHLNL